MTDTTTADKIAAGELIEKYDIEVKHGRDGAIVCESRSGRRGVGESRIAAVSAWAEAAGVPWPAVNVVPMWALDGAIGMHVYDSRISAEQAAHRNNCRIVPCEVVIRTETEATP